MDLRAAASATGRERPPVPRAAIDVRTNAALATLVMLAAAVQLIGLPCALRVWGPAALIAVVPAMVPVIFLTPMHWGLVHEGIHGQLTKRRRLNEWLARTLSIALALPFDTVRFGHLMHHRFTREPYDRPDVHETGAPRWCTWLAYYVRLFGGLYVGELVVPLLAFLPRTLSRTVVLSAVGEEGPVGPEVQRLFGNFAADPARRYRMRRDWLLSLVVYGASFWLYGVWWPVLAATMYLRGLWLSLADNLPHYGVGLGEPGRARNFRVPGGWPVLLMNHHLHQWHHRYPTLPWTALPAVARASGHDASDAHASGADRKNAVEVTTEDVVKAGARNPSIPTDNADTPYFRAALRQLRGPRGAHVQLGVGPDLADAEP